MDRAAPVLAITRVGGTGDIRKKALAEADRQAGRDGCAVVFEAGLSGSVIPTLFASAGAKELQEALTDELPDCELVVRGRVCLIRPGEEAEPASLVAFLAEAVPVEVPLVLALGPGLYREIIEDPACRPDSVLFLSVDEQEGIIFDLLAVARAEARELGMDVTAAPGPEGHSSLRRFGALVHRLLEPLSGRVRAASDERAQVTPLALGAVFLIVVSTVALIALAGAVTGKARVQRTSDLAALASARSMRDDLPRLLAPPKLPNGLPNPAHLPKSRYLGRARLAAVRTAIGNGVGAFRTVVSFPDAGSVVPVRTIVRIPAGQTGRRPVMTEAEARLSVSPGFTGLPIAAGGGYSGPLAVRQGEGMRPDVAFAFDRLVAAARRAGVTVTVTSGYRSDAEQAALFRANPDPRWVAPPGKSLHRCGTELDLGPPMAYGWLAANAPRFGFTKRYSWEPWHFGFTAGPPPCSPGAAFGAARKGPERSTQGVLPDFVPARFRAPILRSAMRWNVSPGLLAAQLLAESNFNPRAVSSAGAMGIAQFMPATAASYGLGDPFDPIASINAQARMMSELIRRFRSIPLALAAYNAGPGAVGSCNCVPPYPETRAYLARIMALLDGSVSMVGPALGIELVR